MSVGGWIGWKTSSLVLGPAQLMQLLMTTGRQAATLNSNPSALLNCAVKALEPGRELGNEALERLGSLILQHPSVRTSNTWSSFMWDQHCG